MSIHQDLSKSLTKFINARRKQKKLKNYQKIKRKKKCGFLIGIRCTWSKLTKFAMYVTRPNLNTTFSLRLRTSIITLPIKICSCKIPFLKIIKLIRLQKHTSISCSERQNLHIKLNFGLHQEICLTPLKALPKFLAQFNQTF